MTLFTKLHDFLAAHPKAHKVLHRGERVAHLVYFAGVAAGFGYSYVAAVLFVLTAFAMLAGEEV